MFDNNVVIVLFPVPGFPSINNDGTQPQRLVTCAKLLPALIIVATAVITDIIKFVLLMFVFVVNGLLIKISLLLNFFIDVPS